MHIRVQLPEEDKYRMNIPHNVKKPNMQINKLDTSYTYLFRIEYICFKEDLTFTR